MEQTTNTQELHIRFSTSGLAWRAAGLIVFGGICWIAANVAGGWHTWAGLLWLAGAVLCALAALPYIARIVTHKPAVVLTPEWIESNALSGHMAIMWQEIAAMFPYTQSRNHYIAIIPDDLSAFLSRLSAWQRFWARLGSYLTPAPFNIWTSPLEVPPDAFWRELLDYGRAHVPHFAEGLDREEPSQTGQADRQPVDDAQANVAGDRSAAPRRARRAKSRRGVWIERLSIPAAGVLVMVTAFPASLVSLDNPGLNAILLTVATAGSVVFALAALLRTRFRGFLAWCSLVCVLSATCFAINEGWGGTVEIIYGLVSVLFVVAVIIFTARFNRRLQRIFSRDPHEP